jgi:tetratricopeptide (TPR) repeat protein
MPLKRLKMRGKTLRAEDLTALLQDARAEGGPGGALKAKRAALFAERANPELAREALALALRLDARDPEPHLQLARMHAEAGELDEAKAEAQQVLREAIDEAARARAAFMLGEIARAEGDETAARNFYETLASIEDAVLRRDRSNPTASRWYARARGRIAELDALQGNFARAKTGAEGALSLLYASATQIGEQPALAADIADAEMRFASVLLDLADANEARRHLTQAIGRYEALAITDESEPHWRALLSDAWSLAAEADYLRGARDEARKSMDKALQARVRLAAERPEETWALAGVWRVRAALLTAIEDADGAAHSLVHARALAERMAAQTSGMEAPARFLVHTLLDQADHALRQRALDVAREAADKARGVAEAYARAAKSAAWRGESGACWDRLGEAARYAGQAPRAQDAFARAAEFRRLASEADPSDNRARTALAAALIKYGEACLEARSPQTGRTAFNECANIRLKYFQAAPNDVAAAHALAVALERVGLASAQMGNGGAARTAWEDELALADRMFADDNSLEALRFRAIVESHLCWLGGAEGARYRQSALAKLDKLASASALTADEAALRKRLWDA